MINLLCMVVVGLNQLFFAIVYCFNCMNRTRVLLELKSKPERLFWPGIDRDIETIIEACKQCQDYLPSLGREPMITHALPERPFQHLAADFAQSDGRNYLIMVDCYTDWPSIQLMNHNTTSHALISVWRDYFAQTTVPDVFWSDGGPQFRSQQLADFLQGGGGGKT